MQAKTQRVDSGSTSTIVVIHCKNNNIQQDTFICIEAFQSGSAESFAMRHMMHDLLRGVERNARLS
tara:strand:- start:203 stop:400 length:198 start_codon:yes stop_codon:yes gene_type:complete